MEKEFLIAGFGGQGILLFGQVLSYAAMLAGKETTWVPSYGPEMRGGTANCMVVVSDDKIRSPLVYTPDVEVIFNKPSLTRFVGSLREGGTLLVVSDLVEDENINRNDIYVYKVPAKGISEDMGEAIFLNMVMLGSLIKVENIVEIDHVESALKNIIPPHRSHLIEKNKEAIVRGYKYSF